MNRYSHTRPQTAATPDRSVQAKQDLDLLPLHAQLGSMSIGNQVQALTPPKPVCMVPAVQAQSTGSGQTTSEGQSTGSGEATPGGEQQNDSSHREIRGYRDGEDRRAEIEAEAEPMLRDLGFREGPFRTRWLDFAMHIRHLAPFGSHPSSAQMQALRDSHQDWVNRPPRVWAGDFYRAVLSGRGPGGVTYQFYVHHGHSEDLCAEFSAGVLETGRIHHNASGDFTEFVCRLNFVSSNGPPHNILLDPIIPELEGMPGYSADQADRLGSQWRNSIRSGESIGTYYRQQQNRENNGPLGHHEHPRPQIFLRQQRNSE